MSVPSSSWQFFAIPAQAQIPNLHTGHRVPIAPGGVNDQGVGTDLFHQAQGKAESLSVQQADHRAWFHGLLPRRRSQQPVSSDEAVKVKPMVLATLEMGPKALFAVAFAFIGSSVTGFRHGA